MVKETSITKSLLTYLNSLPQCKAVKIHGNEFTCGQPDVFCCYRGQTIVIEVKNEVGKTSKLQEVILAEWEKSGAIAVVVRSKAEVVELIGNLERRFKEDSKRVYTV